MADFSNTLRSLAQDQSGPVRVGLGCAAALVAAWGAWLCFGSVAVLERSPARLEVARMAHVVAAPVEGRVVAVLVHLGDEVARGEPLIELEAEPERLRLAEEQARLQATEPELREVESELSALQESRRDEASEAALARLEAKLRAERAADQARLRESETQALLQLGGAVPRLDALRAQTESRRERAEAQAQAAGVQRLELSQRGQQRDHQLRIHELRQRSLALGGELQRVRAAVARLEFEIERRTLRAEVPGRVAELLPLQVGSVVRAGDRLGSLLPSGELRAVALFEPRAALGRLRPGQAGQLRLDGFPWAQFGTVAVQVVQVASEIRDGRVRVELSVQPDPESAIPLQHGLPGVVELEVERTRPLDLLLRAAGQLTSGRVAKRQLPEPLLGSREPAE